MDAYKAIKERRSIRRYVDKEVPEEVLKKCVNAGRLSPSGANLQPLKFIKINKKLEEVFEHTNWAGHLDWDPSKEEMPMAYIAILKKEDLGLDMDAGIAAQSICITALNQGLGSCILGAIDRDGLNKLLPVPDDYEIKLMVALGYPKEEPSIVESEGGLEYFLEEGELQVPKRPLNEVMIEW